MKTKEKILTPEIVNQRLVQTMIDDPGKASKIIVALMAQSCVSICFDQTLAMIAQMTAAIQAQKDIGQQIYVRQLMELIWTIICGFAADNDSRVKTIHGGLGFANTIFMNFGFACMTTENAKRNC